MSLSIDDLKPKDFTVKINGVDLTCKPLRMSHTLIISKVGEVFKNIKDTPAKDIKQAEADMDEVVAELIPELNDTKLDMKATLELITQMMEQIEPADNKELREKGVKFDSDPKAGTIG